MKLPKIPVNEGKVDRGVRLTAGAVFLILAMAFPPLAIVFIVIAIVLLATGAVGYCGLYSLIGVNTCKIKKSL